MNPFAYNTQIEEITYFDPYEVIENDPFISEDEDYGYDDASFNDFLNSGNDF